MNVFSRYCLTFSANDCVFPLNEQQKGYLLVPLFFLSMSRLSGLRMRNVSDLMCLPKLRETETVKH